MKTLSIFFGMILFMSLASPAVYADKKAETKKQLDALNLKIKEAGDKGDLQASIQAAEEVITFTEDHFGKKSLEYARAMNNAANLYLFANYPSNAERLYKSAILIETKRLKGDDPALADSFYNLAMAYAVQNKYKEARSMLTKSYDIRLKKLGSDHPETQKTQQAIRQVISDSISS